MLHVLIVEPYTGKRARIKKMVQEMGHIVVGEARDQEEALRLMEQGWPTLLLTDLMQPRLEGLALMSQVYEQRIPVVTIVLSDNTRFDYVRQSMQAGAIDYLLKPVKAEELRRALQRAEERVVYFHAAHREFVQAQRFFERLDLPAGRGYSETRRDDPKHAELRGGPARGASGPVSYALCQMALRSQETRARFRRAILMGGGRRGYCLFSEAVRILDRPVRLTGR